MSDRLSLAHALENGGIARDAAERVATEIDQMIRGNVATKADVDHLRAELKADIATLETRLTIRAAIIALAGLSALFTALHWWPPSPAISTPAAKPAALLLAADQPPYSCRLLYGEQRKCAFGSCDPRTGEAQARVPAGRRAAVMTKMTATEVRAAAARRHYEPKILDNADRGDIAEEIVAGILEPDWEYCVGAWAGWDFEHRDGTRLQLKQAAARQNWIPKKVGIFSIKRQTGYWANGTDWTPSPTPTRHAVIYIFAWHGETDPAKCDQADPAQWRFYVIPTTQLPDTTTVTLAALERIGGPPYDQDTLAAAVEAARRL